jgi:phosphoribosyl 1,2-cyclic phosphate phosphodiesterase
MKITILGCGTSQGVPKIGGHWGVCDPNNSKNRRRRASILIEIAGQILMIDTGPDFIEQCLSADICHLDAILYTHDHADHTHGIDEIRAISQIMKKKIPVFGNKQTLNVLYNRFKYIFESNNAYPAVAERHEIDLNEFTIDEVKVQPIELIHGGIINYSYRIDNFCYSTDFNEIPQASEENFYGLDLWIVDCLRYKPHPTHCHLEKILAYVEKFKPKKVLLTHMNWELDYEVLKEQLPDHIEPAYDGLILTI